MELRISVIQGSILDVDVEVIVNAANSSGIMGGGVAGVIKRAAGAAVEEEAMRQAPIPVGQAVLSSGGHTKFTGIVHAPTMPEPGMRIPAENVAKTTRAALALADERGFASIALPGLGTGVGGVDPKDAAQQMAQAMRSFVGRVLQRVVLVDIDSAMIAAWKNEMESGRPAAP